MSAPSPIATPRIGLNSRAISRQIGQVPGELRVGIHVRFRRSGPSRIPDCSALHYEIFFNSRFCPKAWTMIFDALPFLSFWKLKVTSFDRIKKSLGRRLTCILFLGQLEMTRSHGHRLRFPELRRLPTQGGGFVSSGDSLLRQSFCFLRREVLTLPAFRSTRALP